MIDPTNITRFDRTPEELEEFLLFCVAVAGKRADTTAKALTAFLDWLQPTGQPILTPFGKIRRFHDAADRNNLQAMHGLDAAIIAFNALNRGLGIGQHFRMSRAFYECALLPFNLATVSVAQLERVHGIGPKTARLFVLHSQPGVRYAVLDTHILKYLQKRADEAATGQWVPARTPNNPREYAALEQYVLGYADEAGMSPADFDLHIWRQYAVGGQGDPAGE